MFPVDRRFRSSYGLVGAALIVGVVLGSALFRQSEPHYAFVGKTEPIRVAEFKSGSVEGTIRVYNIRSDWRALLALVQQEAGQFISKAGTYHGLPAETVVVPRMESGRADLFQAPVREITVLKGRFVRDKSGTEVAIADDAGWSGVRVLEYRAPRFLDQAADWLRDRVRV